eukprot:10451413-Lingulodinium_polyedra.AAC.1
MRPQFASSAQARRCALSGLIRRASRSRSATPPSWPTSWRIARARSTSAGRGCAAPRYRRSGEAPST